MGETLTEQFQADIRLATGTTQTYEGDLHALADAFAIPRTGWSERLLALARKFDSTVSTAAMAQNYFFQNPIDATLAVPFLWTETLDSRLTWTATSLRTRIDQTGLITYTPNNIFLNSATLSNQTVVVRAIDYIISFRGTGTIAYATAATGSLVGTGINTRVSVKISPSAGNLVCTITGSVLDAQIEAVTYQTAPGPYIPTTAAAYYGPEFSYDPVTGASRGLGVWEARTNLFVQSSSYAASWGPLTGITLTPNQIGPDGASSATLVLNTAGGSRLLTQDVTTVAVTAYVYSFFVKKSATNWVGLSLIDGANQAAWTFDVNTGVVGTNIVSTLASTSGIENYGRGWYRCWVRATAASTTMTGRLIPFNDTNGNGTAGNSVFAFGAQLEAGAFVTPYIPTGSASVTRTLATPSLTGAGFSSIYSATEGTFVATAYNTNLTVGSSKCPVSFNNTGTSWIKPYFNTGAACFFNVRDAGVDQCSINTGSLTNSSVNRVAAAYKANDFAGSTNGNAAGTDVSGTVPTVTKLDFGWDETQSLTLNGYIQGLVYFPTRKTNAVLATLSAA